MSEQALNTLIENAAGSVEMEGFLVDEQSKKWCRQLINNEITFAKYIELVKAKVGIN